MNVILACDKNFGIGKNGSLPWHIPEELKIFREKTENQVLIMGKNTVKSLPKLSRRFIICITSDEKFECKNSFIRASSLDDALDKAKENYPNKKVFIAGGKRLYEEALQRENVLLHVSLLKDTYDCDLHINLDLSSFVIAGKYEEKMFEHWEMIKNSEERNYLELGRKILSCKPRSSRNSEVYSTFFSTLSFDLTKGFPLLTTKKMFTKGIIEELLFFLRGETDSKLLEEKGVNIWRKNTSREFLNSLGKPDRKEGIMGPMYGYQWRYFNAKYDDNTGVRLEDGVDQLAQVIHAIKTDPRSRRIILTDYNPLQSAQGVLFPCHSLIVQFYVEDDYLDMSCYNRSQDYFLGLPFNISSSALLLTIIAKICGKVPRKLHMCMGDIHIYSSHVEAVQEQLKRHPFVFPTLIIKKDISSLKEVEELSFQDFEFMNYLHYSEIKAQMVA